MITRSYTRSVVRHHHPPLTAFSSLSKCPSWSTSRPFAKEGEDATAGITTISTSRRRSYNTIVAASQHPNVRLHHPLVAAASFSSSAASQGATNTWCSIEDEQMEVWAAPIVDQVLNIYRCQPHPEIFSKYYAANAVFDDPAGKLQGRAAIRVGCEALTKVFEHGQVNDAIISYHPPLIGGERNRWSDGEMIGPQVRIQFTQHYRCKGGLGQVKLPAVVLLTFNKERLIIRHEDRWWGYDTTSKVPLLGHLHQWAKSVNGFLWGTFGKLSYPHL